MNSLAPEAAAATEVLVEYSDLPDDLYEPLETMAEAGLALCSGDPGVLTGQVVTSLELLVRLDRPVCDLAGTTVVPDWQPADLPPRIELMRRHARGKRVTGANLSTGSWKVVLVQDPATLGCRPVLRPCDRGRETRDQADATDRIVPGLRPTPKARATRARLIETAASTFVEDGYGGFSRCATSPSVRA